MKIQQIVVCTLIRLLKELESVLAKEKIIQFFTVTWRYSCLQYKKYVLHLQVQKISVVHNLHNFYVFK